MLHLITEGNSELKNRKFPIPDGVRKILMSTLENYNGSKTVDGYKRLNNILEMDAISYSEMKRLKNFFDNYRGTEKSTEFILNGGDSMRTWVNNTLKTATDAVENFKQAKKDAGIKNAFIKPHEKNRQTKKKNKPTNVKIKTSNRNVLNNNTLTYESKTPKRTICISESQLEYLQEAIKPTWSSQTFKSLKSFTQRVKYCEEQLGPHIGNGSSRVVFQINDKAVLKLAKNQKGIAQNEEECRTYGYYDIFPEQYANAEDFTWIVSEYVLPASMRDFQEVFGFNWAYFKKFICSCIYYRFGKYYGSTLTEDEYVNLIENNYTLRDFDDYIGNEGANGDIMRMINLGLVERNGKPDIVLLDSGLSEEVFTKYYRRK